MSGLSELSPLIRRSEEGIQEWELAQAAKCRKGTLPRFPLPRQDEGEACEPKALRTTGAHNHEAN